MTVIVAEPGVAATATEGVDPVGDAGTNRVAGGDGADICLPFGDTGSLSAGCEAVLASM